MEEKYIIYPKEDGGIFIVIPTGVLPIEDVAKKDIPEGVPYRYINKVDIPPNRNFRNAWEADFSEPDGYGMGFEKYFTQKQLEETLSNSIE